MSELQFNSCLQLISALNNSSGNIVQFQNIIQTYKKNLKSISDNNTSNNIKLKIKNNLNLINKINISNPFDKENERNIQELKSNLNKLRIAIKEQDLQQTQAHQEQDLQQTQTQQLQLKIIKLKNENANLKKFILEKNYCIGLFDYINKNQQENNENAIQINTQIQKLIELNQPIVFLHNFNYFTPIINQNLIPFIEFCNILTNYPNIQYTLPTLEGFQYSYTNPPFPSRSILEWLKNTKPNKKFDNELTRLDIKQKFSHFIDLLITYVNQLEDLIRKDFYVYNLIGNSFRVVDIDNDKFGSVIQLGHLNLDFNLNDFSNETIDKHYSNFILIILKYCFSDKTDFKNLEYSTIGDKFLFNIIDDKIKTWFFKMVVNLNAENISLKYKFNKYQDLTVRETLEQIKNYIKSNNRLI